MIVKAKHPAPSRGQYAVFCPGSQVFVCSLRVEALLTCISSLLQESTISRAETLCENVNINVWLSADSKHEKKMAKVDTVHHS